MSVVSMKTVKETEEMFKTDIETGLRDSEAKKRLTQYGKNVIEEGKRKGTISKFVGQLNDFLIIILLVAACISFVIGIIDGEGDLTEPFIILAIVVVNAVLGVIQENKAEKSLEMLKKISAPKARVIRDKKTCLIPAEEVVPGDVLVIQMGDVVAADARLVFDCGLETDESAITGESLSVKKDTDILTEKNTAPSDAKNMIFSSTSVISGYGKAIVTETGMDTEVGRVAKLIINSENPETPMQVRMKEVGKKIGIAALLICALVFFIGVIKGYSPLEMFIISVSLAVAAIPEGLPAIVTIMLAIGVSKLAKEGAIVRHMPSVETLGSSEVICTDKTGTITENKMKVTKVFTEDKEKLSLYGMLCAADETSNPTELAIINYGRRYNLDMDSYKKISEEPFSSDIKKMTVVYNYRGDNITISKGASDVLLPLCKSFWNGNSNEAITIQKRKNIERQIDIMAEEALRVILVAYKKKDTFIFLGLFGIEDPPRKEAKEAVLTCKEAGIIPVMITGDHLKTACAIAKKTGIYEEDKRYITGKELNRMTDEELTQNVCDISVYARVLPEHKLRIVKAWQKRGKTVAMTGDGVNDAPALKCADIGCSLGKTGTEVAKSASDMIITDDNFNTIVTAVRYGRLIYNNIKKTVKFLLSGNIGEIFTIFIGILMGFPSPLNAIELLWVNLVTDSLPAIALGMDNEDRNLMREKPSKKELFTKSMMWEVIIEGIFIGALALVAFFVGVKVFGDFTIGRSMAFCTLSISQLVHSFNMRSEESVLNKNFFSNKMLVLSLVLGVIMQVFVVQNAFLSKIFKTVPLEGDKWLFIGIFSIMPLVVVELQKKFNGKCKKN